MIDQPVLNSEPKPSAAGQTKSEPIPQLLQAYIKDSTSIHRQRMERIEEANQILAKEYRAHQMDLDKTKQKKMDFNRELDLMIGMLNEIDRVEAGVIECEKNGKQIFDLLGQIEKKLAAKLQKKVDNLEKIKKKMKN